MTERVALVLVSHSAALAEGLRELAGQMAPGVQIIAAGGDPVGGLGTSADRVEEAVNTAAGDGREVVVLTDLGSAVLTAEMVLELLDEEVAGRVRLADAPLVEGAVAAGVEAAGGGSVEQVLAAAERAGGLFGGGGGVETVAPVSGSPGASADGAPGGGVQVPAAPGPEDVPEGSADGEPAISGQVTVRNPLGLHARPAAVLSRMMAGFDASVQVNGVNAASVLELMQLGSTRGDVLTLSATGTQARAAVDAFIGAVDEGFGEV